MVPTHETWKEQKISTLHVDMTPGWLHLQGAVKVIQKVLEGLEHVHNFPLSSRNVNISIGTPYYLIFGYQTIILTPLILLYELKYTKPMSSLTWHI